MPNSLLHPDVQGRDAVGVVEGDRPARRRRHRRRGDGVEAAEPRVAEAGAQGAEQVDPVEVGPAAGAGEERAPASRRGRPAGRRRRGRARSARRRAVPRRQPGRRWPAPGGARAASVHGRRSRPSARTRSSSACSTSGPGRGRTSTADRSRAPTRRSVRARRSSRSGSQPEVRHLLDLVADGGEHVGLVERRGDADPRVGPAAGGVELGHREVPLTGQRVGRGSPMRPTRRAAGSGRRPAPGRSGRGRRGASSGPHDGRVDARARPPGPGDPGPSGDLLGPPARPPHRTAVRRGGGRRGRRRRPAAARRHRPAPRRGGRAGRRAPRAPRPARTPPTRARSAPPSTTMRASRGCRGRSATRVPEAGRPPVAVEHAERRGGGSGPPPRAAAGGGSRNGRSSRSAPHSATSSTRPARSTWVISGAGDRGRAACSTFDHSRWATPGPVRPARPGALLGRGLARRSR